MVRDGSPQRSTGRSQDSRMRAWKEGAAWQLQHWKKLRFPNEGLEGGAGWQPAAQHWKKPRFPNEGLEGGAGWQPAAQHWKKPRFPNERA